MAKYNTGNALGSADPRDLFDNAENLDGAVNSELDTWVDRFGKTRRTMAGIDHDANRAMLAYGYVTKKSFTLGNTLSNPNEVLFNEGDGEYYRWDGSLPKVVAAGSTPETAGGIGNQGWVSVGDAALRDELANGSGSSVGLTGGKTLKEFSENISHYVGIRKPYFTDWSAGASSNYNDVWRYKDGTYWTGLLGDLPDTPYPYNLRRYNILTDPLAVKELIATIASNDADDTTTGSYDLLGALLDCITGRTGIIVNSSFLSGIGTMSSALTVQPLLYRIGMCQRPFDSTEDNPGMSTLSATEAGSGKPGWVNTFAQSNLGDLGITSGSTTKALVFTGKLQDNFLFRHAVTASGDIYVEVMSSAGTWSGKWIQYYSTRNTTVASDGTLSAASPIVRVVESVTDTERTDLLSLDFSQAGDYGAANSEASGVTVTKQSTGVYLITGCSGLYPDGWQVKDAYPIQGSTPVALGRAEAQSDGSVKVSVYARKMTLDSSTMEVTQTLGDLMDVPATSWIDVRVAMPVVTTVSATNTESEGA